MDQAVKIERIGADVTIVRRHSSSNRRLTFHGSDGSVKHFVVQTSLTPSCKSDERMVQLFRTMNVHLAKHKESRRRNLAFHAPLIVPVWPQVNPRTPLITTGPLITTESSGRGNIRGA